MSKYLENQIEFAGMVPRLIDKAFEMGFEVTLGHAWRSCKCTVGHPQSYHKKRLAIDLNLFKDGIWQKYTEDHTELGEWWESQGGTWGGRWNDGNHYSWGEGR
jgi:hypothetical protein